MRVGPKNFHKSFAGASLCFAFLCASTLPFPVRAATTNTAAKREAANAQFTRAQEMRAALNEKAPEKRTLADYTRVVASFDRVRMITPHSVEVPESLVAVGELNTEMGARFGRSYYDAAVQAYSYLIREYPTSKHAQEAMFTVAQLQKEQLGDTAAATKTFQDFQKKYPRSAHRREVQEALAELALMRNAETGALTPTDPTRPSVQAAPTPAMKPVKSEPAAQVEPESASAEQPEASGIPRIQNIRSTVTQDGEEVVIELEGSVQYVSGRITNPDRIYFDLHAARLSRAVSRNPIQVSGNLLTRVRVAQNQEGVVRVVLDVSGVKDYAASLMRKPSRLVIELYGAGGPRKAPIESAKVVAPSPKPATNTAIPNDPPPAVATESKAPNLNEANVVSADQPAPPAPATKSSSTRVVNARASRSAANSPSAKPELVQPPAAAPPTRDGASTLTRALGLKINRIVLDAGHGGHDTGTIGPTGLMEKDLCLDVALRLGKIIQQKLPGADIVYTRSDDTFIPLEDRTRIANDAKADLFLSIHANSSPDHAARGIETYYLSLRGSAEATEVAARENAVSQESIHDLEDIVKKIARTEKIDESKELAEDVQDSLSKRIQKTAKPVKNRGVRKAPFVVLIGADMPSILTEISFLSNPADEQLLKRPEHRQRVAEGLYAGVSEYLQSLNSVAMNSSLKPGRPAVTPTVEQSRNQQ